MLYSLNYYAYKKTKKHSTVAEQVRATFSRKSSTTGVASMCLAFFIKAGNFNLYFEYDKALRFAGNCRSRSVVSTDYLTLKQARIFKKIKSHIVRASIFQGQRWPHAKPYKQFLYMKQILRPCKKGISMIPYVLQPWQGSGKA